MKHFGEIFNLNWSSIFVTGILNRQFDADILFDQKDVVGIQVGQSERRLEGNCSYLVLRVQARECNYRLRLRGCCNARRQTHRVCAGPNCRGEHFRFPDGGIVCDSKAELPDSSEERSGLRFF